MSRNDDYNNAFDEQDDGEDLEITDEDEAASDDQGREEAALCLSTGRSIRGNGKYDEQHRRMWFRMAQKALAEGRERREEAEAAEKADAAAEKARLAAEEKEDRERIAREAKQQRQRERFERSMRESDERWERLNEETRRENAAWEADRPERERREREAAATPRLASPTRSPASDSKSDQRTPATMTPSHARTTQPPAKPAPVTTLPTSPSAPRSAGVTAQPWSPSPDLTPRHSSGQVVPSQPHRTEPERRVVAPPRTLGSPASAPAATAPAKRLPSPPSWPAIARPPSSPTPNGAMRVTPTPAPVAATVPSHAFTPQSTAVLTGADLAAWRSARGLTQRPAADLLGVAPSTVAKAELLPGKALGEQLQVALAAALAR